MIGVSGRGTQEQELLQHTLFKKIEKIQSAEAAGGRPSVVPPVLTSEMASKQTTLLRQKGRRKISL